MKTFLGNLRLITLRKKLISSIIVIKRIKNSFPKNESLKIYNSLFNHILVIV